MQSELLKIAGMFCGSCISTVTQALIALPGVSDIDISLATGEATVKYDEQLTSFAQLKAAVQEAGYGVDGTDPARKPQGKGGCCCGCG